MEWNGICVFVDTVSPMPQNKFVQALSLLIFASIWPDTLNIQYQYYLYITLILHLKAYYDKSFFIQLIEFPYR